MSDAPVPDNADSVPSVDELERTAIPATFRRAPRLGRIVGTGIAFGAGFGLVLGFSLPNSTGVGRGMVAILLAIGFGMIGALTAGAIATRLDGPDAVGAEAAKTAKAQRDERRRARKAAKNSSEATD